MPLAAWFWTAPVLWLLLGGVLLSLVLLGIDTDGLILIAGGCALLMSMLTAILPLPPLLAVAFFLAGCSLAYSWLRRWAGRQRESALPRSAQAERASVISGFGSGTDHPSCEGRVLWQGQSWAAVNLEEEHGLEPGASVLVMGREGTRLQVLPEPTCSGR
ncbi:MAG: NfeD family protein [Cyanobacteriota bacterium]|nr:NfeD family protein [Cyanobacteriota bacterium]